MKFDVELIEYMVIRSISLSFGTAYSWYCFKEYLELGYRSMQVYSIAILVYGVLLLLAPFGWVGDESKRDGKHLAFYLLILFTYFITNAI